MRCVLIVTLALVLPRLAMAQDGGVIVRIPDGVSSTCVTPNHRVFLTLRRLITSRKSGWLVKDNAVALVVNAGVISSDKAGGMPDRRTNFPLASSVNVREYATGQVSLPIEYGIVSGLPLTQDKAFHRAIQLELTLINMKAKTGLGKGLEALVEVSKNLPIPSTPLVSAGSYLLDYANKAVQKEIDAHNSDDKAKSATILLQFDDQGKCGGDFERTGTVAVLQAAGPVDEGRVDINQTNNYCWAADLKPAFVLKAAKKDPAKPCTAQDYKPSFFQVTNNYSAFFLNAVPVSRSLGPYDKEQVEALARCAAHGLTSKACLGQD